MIPAACLLINALFLIIFIACFFKHLKNLQSLPLHTSWLFSLPLNDNIVDIEKPDETCLPTFVADLFSGLFLHPPIFCQRFKIFINNKRWFVRFLILIKLWYLNVFRRHYKITKIFIFTYVFVQIKFVLCSKRMKKTQAIKVNIIFWCYSSWLCFSTGT